MFELMRCLTLKIVAKSFLQLLIEILNYSILDQIYFSKVMAKKRLRPKLSVYTLNLRFLEVTLPMRSDLKRNEKRLIPDIILCNAPNLGVFIIIFIV